MKKKSILTEKEIDILNKTNSLIDKIVDRNKGKENYEAIKDIGLYAKIKIKRLMLLTNKISQSPEII
ncbi:MAG: hypothetical protein WC026_13280 [Hyphomicrobium sp.]|uniref:hypothetical protein n=1 Tax=Hyphomicrobium sp. TaxID=82 RepID=UPI0035698CB6